MTCSTNEETNYESWTRNQSAHDAAWRWDGDRVAYSGEFETSVRCGTSSSKTAPRMVCVYTPHGVRNSQWYPKQTGFDYELSPTLQALEPVRKEVSVLTGLCHPRMSANVGHAAAGRWLTGVREGDRILVDFASPNQSLSMDQLAAARVGAQTRWPSLQLSTEAGAGLPGRSKTLSFNARGIPLPAMNKPPA